MSMFQSEDLFDSSAWRDREERVWTVSELVRVCATLLEEAFPTVVVEGEVSEVSTPRSGHVYLTLKDEGARLPAVIFRSDRRRIPYEIEVGMHVRCRGRLSIYVQGGRFQLYVSWLEPAGIGRLMADLERLKAKLQQEGLFDEARKRPLPRFPRVIGVVTSATGAAIRDIVKVVRRRWPARIVLSPASVQGSEAPAEIVAALERLVRAVPVEVVICGRGGGSVEDLWAFNDERVVRAIASCPVPVISAVGHERDFVLSDLAADVRAATPSAAAQLVVPDRREVIRQVDALSRRLSAHVTRQLETARVRLRWYEERLKGRTLFLHEPRQRLDEQEQRLQRAILREIGTARQRLAHVSGRLKVLHPRHRLSTARAVLSRADMNLRAAILPILATKRQHLGVLEGKLQTLGPHAVLERGYCLLLDERRRPVRRWDQVSEGSRVLAQLQHGGLTCLVEQRHPELTSPGSPSADTETTEAQRFSHDTTGEDDD